MAVVSVSCSKNMGVMNRSDIQVMSVLSVVNVISDVSVVSVVRVMSVKETPQKNDFPLIDFLRFWCLVWVLYISRTAPRNDRISRI